MEIKPLFIQQDGIWMKTYNVYNKNTKFFTTKTLPTTEFEKTHGYSKQQAKEWGLVWN